MWVLAVSVLMFVGSIVLMWVIIVRLPVDYLNRQYRTDFARQHPLARVITVIVKNSLGLMLVIMGLVMLLTPGQGVLSIFLGITLMDFPGKRTLIRRMLGGRRMFRMINQIRAEHGGRR